MGLLRRALLVDSYYCHLHSLFFLPYMVIASLFSHMKINPLTRVDQPIVMNFLNTKLT